MKKLVILAIILVTILTIIISLTMVSSKGNYIKIMNTPEYTHSSTKAICNSENLCQDYEIFCKDQRVIKISQITGAVVQFPADWEDPRDEEMRNKVC